MKIFSYTDHAHPSPEELFNNDSPVQFIKGFSEFYKQFHNDEVYIFYSENLNAYIPIRHFKVKVFRFGQILHAPISDNIELTAENQQQFFTELLLYIKSQHFFERLIQPHPFGIMLAVPQGAQSCAFGTYISYLQRHTDDEVLHTYDPKYRKAINHAAKGGAEVRFGWNEFENFYSLYTQTTSRAGIYCDPVHYFETLYRCLNDEHIDCGVVYDNGQPVGGILMLYSKYSALCTHAGSGGESKLYGAMKLLHYEMMKRMKARGVKYYDLVGVRIGSNNESLEGVFRFKKGFGGELKEGFLWKTDIAPLKSKMYDLLLKLKGASASATRDIIDQESN